MINQPAYCSAADQLDEMYSVVALNCSDTLDSTFTSSIIGDIYNVQCPYNCVRNQVNIFLKIKSALVQ